VLQGELSGSGLRFAVVVARFNEYVTRQLLLGAEQAFQQHGVDPDAVDVAWVPGCFEVPLAARKMAESGRYDAVVCLGTVIRGETPHFEYVAGQAAAGVARVGQETSVPAIFGILTTDTLEQAVNRAGAKFGNKGYEAAVNAIEMANLLRKLRPD
jgi:6,7-dimethyl-8-ribityllumazine synthase